MEKSVLKLKSYQLLLIVFLLSFPLPRSITMMGRVALGTWLGGLKPFKDLLLKTDDHHLEVNL
jgi:hypothetical protein